MFSHCCRKGHSPLRDTRRIQVPPGPGQAQQNPGTVISVTKYLFFAEWWIRHTLNWIRKSRLLYNWYNSGQSCGAGLCFNRLRGFFCCWHQHRLQLSSNMKVELRPVLRSRSFFDRLRLQVLFFTGSGSFSYKNRLKSSKKNVFAFTSSHTLRLRPKSTGSNRLRLRNTDCDYINKFFTLKLISIIFIGKHQEDDRQYR